MTSCLKLTENLTYFELLDSKADALLKTCFKICFFFESLDSKTFFSLFFSISWFLRNRITEENGVFAGWKGRKVIFCKQIIHQYLFLYKSSSLQNVICCKTFFRNLTRSKISIRNCRVVKKWLYGKRVWKFDSKNDALYEEMIQKPIIFKNFDPNFLFWMKKFFCNNFSNNFKFLKTVFSAKSDAL